MKTQLLTWSMLLLAFTAVAQNKTNKNNLSAGGGFEQYKGDLGNSFFDFKKEWYGVIKVTYNRYLNRSLDAHTFATIGELGRCSDEPFNPEKPVLMLRSRFKTLGINLKYKLANGYCLREDARFAPYLYGGLAANQHKDIWSDTPRVNEGYYISINYGLGLYYNLSQKFQLVYNLGFGYFTTDAIDFISAGKNDMYLQSTMSIGYNF